MTRSILSVMLAATLILGAVSPAAATTATISPSTQSHAHGVASQWNLSWSGHSPFKWEFDFGDGAYTGSFGAWVSYTSKHVTYAFYPCSWTQFNQSLVVDDAWGIRGVRSSYASENGGNPC